ncbi:MAG: Gfo/Idh/MocA family oxidoreductase [Acidobacteriaceae bacterium]|nr:Gfo/Idh/MocA family oxidoreductase [Acidobacteriaceae bacterium]
MSYRAGIIGCGRIGCAFDDDPRRGYVSTHAGAYTRTPGIELVALSDIDDARLKSYGDKFNVPGRYVDYRRMLETEKLDAVSVCTWDRAHLEIVRAAVEHRVKAIFCEKPIADSLESADEMVRLCAENDVLLMIDHQRRFHPFHQQLSKFLRDGGLGRIQQVTCYYTAGAANTGSHLFDLLRFYLGDVTWVQGRLSGNASPNPSDPNIDGWIGFENGSVAAIQACDVKAYLIFEIDLLGTAGRFRIVSSGFDASYEEVRDSERFSGYKELAGAPMPVSLQGPHEFMLFGVAHLVDCLRTGQRPISSGEDGRAALEVIRALQDSAQNGSERIDLPLAGILNGRLN